MNISSKQIQWILNKATSDIVLSKQSITLDSNNLTDTFTVTTNSTGNLSISSSDTSIATVSLSGNTATVKALANGICTITVNVVEDSNYIDDTKALSVNVQLVSTTLNDNSWDTIKTTIQLGGAASLWNVGDTKEVILNGTVGSKSFSSYSCYATILGFDHNASLETSGGHSIHFILAKDSTGKDICFYSYSMNNGSHITTGGWKDSYMKKTTMMEFKNCLSEGLKTVLKNVTKYTHNTTGSNENNSSSNVTASTEQVFLLSEFEVFGTKTEANTYEQNKQTQYVYYKNGNSKVRYRDDNLTRADTWWLRSPFCNGSETNTFCYVYKSGIGSRGLAGTYYGIAPAFVV